MLGLCSGSDQVGRVQVFSFLGLLFLRFTARLQVLQHHPAVKELFFSLKLKSFGLFAISVSSQLKYLTQGFSACAFSKQMFSVFKKAIRHISYSCFTPWRLQMHPNASRLQTG